MTTVFPFHSRHSVGRNRRPAERGADGYAPIAEYGFLSDCRSSALVARDGSVDWLCWPRFDSPSVFARILDNARGGSFAIAPTGAYTAERSYVKGTNVLETVFFAAGGSFRVTDWLDTGGRQALCRLVECLDGEVELDLFCDPRPGYGAETACRERLGSLVWDAHDDNLLVLEGMASPRERTRLCVGEVRGVTLGWNGAGPSDVRAARERAIRFWREWSRDLELPRDAPPALQAHVERSALTLKGLQYAPSGAFVAAASASLPETVGGARNWDYRFSWLRDSTFTLYALRAVGKTDEAEAWLDWLKSITIEADSLDLQIMYGVRGERELPELELDHLEGHRASRPVRIGNGAAGQRQLDVYGELADAIWLTRSKARTQLPTQRWALVKELARHALAEWREPDQGLWEVRGEPQHFVYSKVMCWVALDRAIRLVARDGFTDAPLEEWRGVRDEIKREVLARGYDAELGAFTQSYGSGTLDASNLLIAQVGFLPTDDPRFVSTVLLTQRKLTRNGFVDRYRAKLTDDGFDSDEATFTICTFWLILALCQIGAHGDAAELFDRTVSHASDLGLLSEQLTPDGEQLGNFPQAFTHIALIACAFALARTSTAAAPRLRLAAVG